MFSWIASEGWFWYKLSKVPFWEIVNTTFFFLLQIARAQLLYLSFSGWWQPDFCCFHLARDRFVFDTVCFVLTGRYPLLHITKSMYRGAADGMRTQAHNSSDRTAYPRGSRCHISHYIKPCEAHFVWSCYGYLLDPAGPRGKRVVQNVSANILSVWNI